MGCGNSSQKVVDTVPTRHTVLKQDNGEQSNNKGGWMEHNEPQKQPLTDFHQTYRIGVQQDAVKKKSSSMQEAVEEPKVVVSEEIHIDQSGRNVSSVRHSRLSRRNLTMLDFIPQIPQHFVQPSDYDATLNEVFSSEFLQSERGICILDGPGGSGKTALMLSLIRSERVRKRFPDGVIWVNLTESTSVEMAICQLYDLVQTVGGGSGNSIFVGSQGGPALSLISHLDCSNHLLQDLVCMLGGRSHLLVLDNVWDIQIVNMFKHIGIPMAVTTRNMELCQSLQISSSKEVSVTPATVLGRQMLGKMSLSDISQLFEKICGMKGDDDHKLKIVIEETSNSPLEMVLLAGLVRQVVRQVDQNTFIEVITDLPKHLNQVKYHIQLQHAVAVSTLSQGHLNLWRTTAFVFEYLGEQLQRKALALALLPKGHYLTLQTLQTLWTLDADAAHKTVQSLVQHFLVQVFSVESQDLWVVHDLVLDFLKHRVLSESETVREFHKKQLSYLTSAAVLKQMYRTHNYSAIHLLLQKLQELGQEPDVSLERPGAALDPNFLQDTNDVDLLLVAVQVYVVVGRLRDAVVLLERIVGLSFTSNDFSSHESLIQFQLDAPYLLSCIFNMYGRHEEAVQQLQRCYETLSTGALSLQFQALIRCFGMYAELLYRTGNAMQARAVVQQVIKMMGQDGNMMGGSLWLVRVREVLVQVEMSAANFEVAEMNAVQGITTVEQFLGRHHPFIINMLHCHANTCYQLKKWTKCQSSMCRAFAVAQGVFGIYSVEALRAMNELAVALLAISKAQDALQVLREAQLLAQQISGSWSMEVAYIIGNQALSQLLMGNSLKAWKLASQSLEILEKSFGGQSKNRSIANGLQCLAVASADMKNFKSAQDLVQKCINIRKQVEGGGGGQGTAAGLESQGSILIQAGEQQEAVAVLTECVDLSIRRHQNEGGGNQVDLAKPYKLLSQAYSDIGDKQQQQFYTQKYLDVLADVPKDHPALHWVQKMEEHEKQMQLYLSHKGVPPVSDYSELEEIL